MRVLFYSPLSIRFGAGFEHWIIEIAPRLRRAGISSSLLSTASTVGQTEVFSTEEMQNLLNRAYIEYLELPYVSLPLGHSPIPKLYQLKSIAPMMRDSSVIYFSNAYALQDVFVYSLKRKFHKPVVSGQHATLFSESVLHNNYVKTVGRYLLGKFDAHHVLNRQDKELFSAWKLRNIYSIPLGVDTNKFKPGFRGYHQKFRVLFIGRLTLQKGVDILCHCLEEMTSNETLCQSMEFRIAGVGPLQRHVMKLAQEHGNVKYFGRVADQTLPELYRSSDLFVMPSRRETFGMTMLEAQATGLPVVASDIPGPDSVVINNTTGTLIRRESSEDLVSAITSYYALWSKDYDKYKRICYNARENVVKRYDLEIVAGHISKMLVDTSEISDRSIKSS